MVFKTFFYSLKLIKYSMVLKSIELSQKHPQKIFGNVTFLQIITINSNQIFAGKKNYFIFLNET